MCFPMYVGNIDVLISCLLTCLCSYFIDRIMNIISVGNSNLTKLSYEYPVTS